MSTRRRRHYLAGWRPLTANTLRWSSGACNESQRLSAFRLAVYLDFGVVDRHSLLNPVRTGALESASVVVTFV